MRATSWAGTKSATTSCANISRLAQGRMWTRLQRHCSTRWTPPEGPDGLKLLSQSISPIPAVRRGRLLTSSLAGKQHPPSALWQQMPLQPSSWRSANSKADKTFARFTLRKVSSISRAPSVDADISGEFTTAELRAAIGNLRQGKSPGHDNIHPEFVTHQSETTSAWLCSFFTSCFQRSKLPKTWRRAAVIALLKPGKTAEDPKAYRPISLLCVPLKILERMILSRIEPVVDPQLPREQACFPAGQINSRSSNPAHPGHRGQLSGQRQSWGSVARPNGRIWHRLAPWTSPEAAEDNPRPAYGEVPNGDAVQPQLHPSDQRWPAKQTEKIEERGATGVCPLTTAV